MRRALLGFALVATCSFSQVANGERLIFIPTAHMLPAGMFRAEGFYNPGAVQWQIGYVAVTLPPSYEIEFRNERFGQGNGGSTFDFTYNLLNPVSDIAPGVAFGVQDALGTTQDGRRFFFCVTSNTAMETELSHNLYVQTTLGMFFGKNTSPFVGTSFPFGTSLRLLVEDNGIRPAIGLELKPLRYLSFKYLMRDGAGYMTMQFTGKL